MLAKTARPSVTNRGGVIIHGQSAIANHKAVDGDEQREDEMDDDCELIEEEDGFLVNLMKGKDRIGKLKISLNKTL